tara:strand:- start:43 stop:1272 length:1230 start_codon:yes stop_codon:yes gene_type:complete
MALLGKQKDLDKNKDGEISGEDFAMLREQRMSGGLLDDDMGRLALAEGPKDDGNLRTMRMQQKAMQMIQKSTLDDVAYDQMIIDMEENKDISAFRKPHSGFDMFLQNQDSKDMFLNLLKNRDKILEREPMILGGLAKAAAKQISKLFKPKRDTKKYWDGLRKDYLELTEDEKSSLSKKFYESMEENSKVKLSDKEFDMLMWNEVGDGSTDYKPFYQMPEEYLIEKGFYREQKAEGGEMLPDEQMEQNFVDFVMSEALSPEEKSMLEEQLEANPELSIMFDKVVETASEFTGAGPVEGPGTGTSDDIPARLSDGEFVFTAKAVEQIGADNLMQMMKDAEAAHDAGGEREAMQEGGMPSNTEKVEVEYTINRPADAAVSGVTPLLAEQEQEDMMDEEIKKSMLGLTPYVRS